MRNLQQLDDDARDRLCGVLNAFVVASDVLIEDMWRSGPSVESRAAVDVLAQDQFDGVGGSKTPVLNAQQAALFMLVAAMDHARGFTIQLNSGAVSIALATTVRGTLEAVARTAWMLEAKDARELIHRSLSLTSRELNMQMSIDSNGVLAEVSGNDTTVAAELELVLEAIRAVAPDGKPLACGATKLTSNFATRINSNGRALYSHLSAVAHGEALGINSFLMMKKEGDSRSYLFVLPGDRAVNYAENVFSSLSLCIRDFMSYYDFPRAAADDWGQLHDNCLHVLLELRPSMN